MQNEVIIDGVNVAECEFFEPKAQVMQCHRGAITQRCKENNCYFKQLQRAKSENEKLKNNLSDAEAIILTYQTELKELYKSNDKLQAENKKLKKEIMLIRQGYDEESCIETCPEVQALRKELDNFRRID